MKLCALNGRNGLTLAWTSVIKFKLEGYDSDEFCRRRNGNM